MAMKSPVITEVAFRTYVINLFGLSSSALLVGDKKALLIDTGCGNYDLKGLIGQITDKPLVVAVTHGHGDHSGGIFQFEEIYVSPGEHDELAHYNRDFWTNFILESSKTDKWGCFDIPLELIPYEYPEHEFKDLYHGQVIDLGRRPVTVLEAPGHTPGSMVFIDHKERILFTGDACNTNLGIEFSAADALRALKVIKEHEGMFDRNFTSHLCWSGDLTSACSDGPETLNGCVAILQGIVDGTKVGQEIMEPTGKAFVIEEDGVRVTYNPERIFA